MAPSPSETEKIGQGTAIHSPRDFSAFFDEVHRSVFRFIYGLHGGPTEDVEDLTAETFFKAWKARDSFHGTRQAALSWVLRIARNLVYDSFRRRKRTDEPLDLTVLKITAPGPEDAYQSGDDVQKLIQALQHLNSRNREMVILRYVLGWRVKDIAQHLGIPENTVSVNLRRSLARIRDNWDKDTLR